VFWDRPLLAVETSCDETSASVVWGRTVLSLCTASQDDLHAKWGGVVPEHAARQHIESLIPILDEAITQSGVEPQAVAVTNRPGLVGSLSVGISAAKAMAYAWQVPLIGIHHLEGHLFSVFEDKASPELPAFPLLSLIVSGGHTELIRADAPGEWQLLGETLDDAAGEAFDKGARLLGLGYPGGRELQALAESGSPTRYPLPRGTAKDPLNFSYSGLKTAMLRLVEREGESLNKADAAASLQEAIVDSLAKRAMAALDEHPCPVLTLVGGVSANLSLRARLETLCSRRGIRFLAPRLALSTDNAAMIGLAASFRLARGESSGWDLDAHPSAPLPGLG
jgi:N6-L-threonylcarbamoyladenine synthase